MSPSPVRRCVALLPLLFACERTPELVAPPLVVEAPPAEGAPVQKAAPPTRAPGLPDPRLPIVGDPLGLLSKAAPGRKAARGAASDLTSLPPDALSAARASETVRQLDRDPRAVQRAQDAAQLAPRTQPVATGTQTPIREQSAAQLVARVRNGAARPHVLFLYASYCPACREVLPELVELAASYRGRAVQFSAASVDSQPSDFEAYAPALRGVLEPIWITPEKRLASELRGLGIDVPERSFSIPLLAVFDKSRKLVTQGHSASVRQLASILDKLL